MATRNYHKNRTKERKARQAQERRQEKRRFFIASDGPRRFRSIPPALMMPRVTYMDSFIHRMIDAIDKRGPLPLIIDRDLIR